MPKSLNKNLATNITDKPYQTDKLLQLKEKPEHPPPKQAICCTNGESLMESHVNCAHDVAIQKRCF